MRIEVGRFRSKQAAKITHMLYIEANSVANANTKDKTVQKANEFTTTDFQMIGAVANSKPDPFHLIVNSICPAIYGHEVVKAGLTLTLFGGVQKYEHEASKIRIRGDTHMLIVGDPGLGKSQLLTSMSRVSPRGVYICGNTTTMTGLTVTVVKDKATNDYTLEAGALVLADKGVCCIDEFDKMKAEHRSLLEAMEQQSISIAKAGIVCNLPARCSVIAAANPVGGHYNRAKTVAENLKINPALLSRFDLIFILLDKPDEKLDALLSEHVLRNYKEQTTIDKVAGWMGGSQERLLLDNRRTQIVDEQQTLKQRLRLSNVDAFDPLPLSLIRKYVAYTRRFVNPKLSRDASNLFQEFYMSLREKYTSSDCTPITTRQLEALVRLGQARARLRCSLIVSEQDALDVIEIMKESMYDVLTDEHGQVDFRRNATYRDATLNRFVEFINRECTKLNKNVFSFSELQDFANKYSLNFKYNFSRVIEKLNSDGTLLLYRGKYKFVAGQ